ncbi:MAG TPA: hypothetical protein VLJ10_00550 [Candidatus Bathyarchaeia archaeon]|nr:hypothetical protein [Candidatus Bathyarchaeia archaeon]
MGLFPALKKNQTQRGNPQFTQDRHFLFMENMFGDGVDEALLWGWSSWWPKDGDLQYHVLSSGGMATGALCELVLKKKWARVALKGKVVSCAKRVLEIEWSSGLIKARELVTAEERSNGMRIDHQFIFVGSNRVMQFLWILVFRKWHNQCVVEALDALKKRFDIKNAQL